MGNLKHRQLWTEDDIKFVVNNRKSMSIEEIAERIGRSPYAVRTAIQRRGLCDKRPRWTGKEEAFLKTHWHIYRTRHIAKILNKSPDAVADKARYMGLKLEY